MINGITVLHQYEVGGPSLVGQIIVSIMIIALLGITLWNVICKMRHKDTFMDKKHIIYAIITAATMFIAMLWTNTWVPHTEYKVTIDDSVSYVEFTESYKVVSQEGSIYTIREVKGE